MGQARAEAVHDESLSFMRALNSLGGFFLVTVYDGPGKAVREVRRVIRAGWCSSAGSI